MARSGGEGDPIALSPDEAFTAVGNETRIQILRTLGEAEPLSFSDLYDRVDVADTGNFTYHLEQLVGQFVHRTDDEYRLREPGSIVVQAVLSGVLTEAPVLEPTRLDADCPFCGARIEVSFADERVLVRCTDCPGNYSGSDTDVRFLEAHPHGTIAIFALPPAGLDDRTAHEVLEVGLGRAHNELLAFSCDVCPRCSATVDRSLQVCSGHDAGDGICERCDRRRALHVDYRCTNCIRVEENIPAGLDLVREPTVMSFLSGQGINPVMPSWKGLALVLDYEETLRSDTPLEARFDWTVDGGSIAVTVDEDMTVIDGER